MNELYQYQKDDIIQPSPLQVLSQKSKNQRIVQWKRTRTISATEEYEMVPASLREEHWYDWIVEIFKKPSAEKLAYREYEESRRNLLQCQRMRDYYDNMVKFEAQRIKRLRKILEIDEE
jgi:hypothetical protein